MRVGGIYVIQDKDTFRKMVCVSKDILETDETRFTLKARDGSTTTRVEKNYVAEISEQGNDINKLAKDYARERGW